MLGIWWVGEIGFLVFIITFKFGLVLKILGVRDKNGSWR
jgi:hypothetical protein